jgi:hypothetical protein
MGFEERMIASRDDSTKIIEHYERDIGKPGITAPTLGSLRTHPNAYDAQRPFV